MQNCLSDPRRNSLTLEIRRIGVNEGELVKSDSGKSQTKEINLELNERHKVPVVRVEHKNRMILM